VFKNSVLRKTFRPKMDKITGGWRKRNNEAFVRFEVSTAVTMMIIINEAFNHVLFSFLNIIRNQGGKGGACNTNGREVSKKFW
jgi:hypothetical protein